MFRSGFKEALEFAPSVYADPKVILDERGLTMWPDSVAFAPSRGTSGGHFSPCPPGLRRADEAFAARAGHGRRLVLESFKLGLCCAEAFSQPKGGQTIGLGSFEG